MEADLKLSPCKLFRKRLKFLYKKIDLVSNLLWSHDNHITGKRLRSENNDEETELKWKNKETTQTGYGEIAMGSMISLFNFMQNVSNLLDAYCEKDPKLKDLLLESTTQDYNMTQQSLFLDIGSGFGKPVYHCAIQVGCESKGIEVVPARVEFCIDFYYEYLFEKKFFEELEKKIKEKEQAPSASNMCAHIVGGEFNHSSHASSSRKIKIFCNGTGSSYVDLEMSLYYKIKLNTLNGKYYDEIMRESTCNSFLELRVNCDVINQDGFIEYLIDSQKVNKSILIEDCEPTFDHMGSVRFPFLQYGKHFISNELEVEITPIYDILYSNVANILTRVMYNDNDTIDNDIVTKVINTHEKVKSIYDISGSVENLHLLNTIMFVNILFNGRIKLGDCDYYLGNKADYVLRFSNRGAIANEPSSSSASMKKQSKPNADLYKELKKELESKEKLYLNNMDKNSIKNCDESFDECTAIHEDNEQLLKETLCDLKFCEYNERWYQNAIFIAEDATKYKCYTNDKKEHFTHIYSYNKLMSKECRSKIAKILNKTQFKVLAWYSNPRQTKEAGLKNFTFIAKFPMQSTSTEKFHVYFYIKTK